jgi:hypothetical protein
MTTAALNKYILKVSHYHSQLLYKCSMPWSSRLSTTNPIPLRTPTFSPAQVLVFF